MYTEPSATSKERQDQFDMLYGALKYRLDQQFGIKVPADWEARVVAGELDAPLSVPETDAQTKH